MGVTKAAIKELEDATSALWGAMRDNSRVSAVSAFETARGFQEGGISGSS